MRYLPIVIAAILAVAVPAVTGPALAQSPAPPGSNPASGTTTVGS